MPTSKSNLTPRPSRTVHVGQPPNSQYTPSKPSTRAGTAAQTRIRDELGIHNNADMFLHDVELFLKDYAPRAVKPGEIEGCINRLNQGPNPIIETQDGKLNWKVCPMFQDKYEGKAGHKDVVFKPLQQMFDAILGQEGRSNEIRFKLCPQTKIDDDLPGGSHLIDGCFMLGDPLQTMHLCHRDLVIAIQLKKWRDWRHCIECHRQMIGASHHILSEDPRRMWIYGLTVERNMMSVWYFSRSHSVKTFAFDWLEDVRTAIEIILSFALATPAQLGIDPTVHKGPLVRDKKTCSYVYEVPGSATSDGLPRFYKTGQSRVPERPTCIAGRATRIWDVIEVDSPDGQTEISQEVRILKDVWLNATTQTEAENMDEIFKNVDCFVTAGLEAEFEEELKEKPDLKRDPATRDRLLAKSIDKEKRFKNFDAETKHRLRGYLTDKKYQSLFLTKRYAWRGEKSKKLGKNVLHCPTLFTSDSITTSQTGSQSATPESHYRNSYQSPEIEIITQQVAELALKGDTLTTRRFVPKQQFRFVYDEVCERIDRLPTLGDVVDVLSEAVDALHILFLADWVHRDISVGNILAVRAPPDCGHGWTVKLSDLEFSQLMIDDKRVPRSDPRAGTPFFMATEILRRRYRFQDFRLANTNKKIKRTASLQRRNDTATLAAQVQEATQLHYPHLTAFRAMPFNISLLDSHDLDPSKIPSNSSVVNHNFQHDLESIWWILMWFITRRVHNERPSPWAAELFQHDVNKYHVRLIAFDNPVGSHLQENLPEVLNDGLFPECMELLRDYMNRYYLLRPIYGQLDDPESYSDIHNMFADCLHFWKRDREAQWRNLVVTPTPDLI